ncbi:MAG: LysM peptidoglycan-binding domain-containing protein [Treponema sp.]|nr:LysM peptidoglycan-binding domain-containing protein [Treponema sp.]MDY5759053.1 LysM peptidoglycan-binding domain-containing protein [Treponema sp.]
MKTHFGKLVFIISIFLFFTTSIFADITYKVEKGDTLYSISRKYQITVAELRTANNLSENDVIKVGQKLIIPDADIGTAAALSSTKTAGSSASASTAKTVEYVVAKGDTLYGIARKNGMTVADLMAINKLDSSAVIKVGQKLKVSAGSTSSSSSAATTKKSESAKPSETVIKVNEKALDTRTYGTTITADANTKWPVSSPKITQVKGKISGVQLSAKTNEAVLCIHEGTVMYVGVYRGFGQVVFVQSKTGLIYAYTGLGSVKVRKGEYAVSGAELGTAGLDSISQKYQITFMVFQNGQPIDPAKAPRN